MRLGNIWFGSPCILPLAAGLLCLSTAARPQGNPQAQPQPQSAAASPVTTIQATTREVLLDVVVTDSAGRAVSGLTAADFVISEEGQPQHLTHLEEHRPMSAADLARLKAAPLLPPNTFSNYLPVENTNASTVLLLDALDTPVQAQMELRQQIVEYLKHMEPGTPIAIFQVDTEMRLIQGFSANPQTLLDAAKSKRDMPSLRQPSQGSREEYRRARLDILRAGFRSMGRYLAGFPGRKNLIWFTAQVPETYLSHPLESSFGKSFKDDFSVLAEDPGDNPADLTGALTLSRVAVYPIDARGLQSPPQYDATMGGHFSAGADRHFETVHAFQHLELDQIADQTGGRAYYNTNGLKEVIAEIVANGSNYYTLAYSTNNDKWEGQLRHIKLSLARKGLHAQYRHGYHAYDRAKQEQRLLAAIQKKKAADASHPFSDTDADQEEAETTPPSSPGENTASATPGNGEGKGAVVPHPKGGFEASMQLGAIPPTEVILTASLSVDNKVVKLEKSATLPEGNYLQADWKGKPFRTYTLQIKADARTLRLRKTPGGMRDGSVEFVSVVYDQSGHQVNSIISTVSAHVNEANYRKLLLGGLPVRQQIAIPVKGNYFLRVGVHDIASDHIGALEIPVDEIHSGTAGAGQ